MIHGIGQDRELQKTREKSLQLSMSKVLKGGYFASKYHIVTQIIDWKSNVDSSRLIKRMKKIQVESNVKDARDAFDVTIPDALVYFNKRFRSKIFHCIVG